MIKLFYSLVNRTKIAVLLAVILVVVLAKNIWEKQSIENINQSFSSIYNDRLLPATYIFKITKHLYQKHLLLKEDNLVGLDFHSKQIDSLLTDFENTNLVAQEKIILSKLKKNLELYNKLELKAISYKENTNQTELIKRFNLVLNELEALSKIQTTVGNDLRNETNQRVANSSVLSELEIAILVVLGLIIQVLIFVSKTAHPKTIQKHHLN